MKSESIDSLWLEGNLPMVNGIVFQNGHVIPFTIFGYGTERKISSASPYNLNDFLKRENAVLSSVDSLGELKLKDRVEFVRAICGEGSYGSDGFIVVLDNNDRVCWVAVFDCSNPFVRLIQRGDDLIAVNNSDEHWVFPLSDPGSFYVNGFALD